MQIPTWDSRLFDLKAGRRKPGLLRRDPWRRSTEPGVALTELSTHLQGQLVASHSAYDVAARGICSAANLPGIRKARRRGPCSSWSGRPRPAGILGSMRMPRSQARWRGPSSIPGRSGLRASSKRLSGTGSPLAADPERLSMRRASMSVLSFIPAKICTTA